MIPARTILWPLLASLGLCLSSVALSAPTTSAGSDDDAAANPSRSAATRNAVDPAAAAEGQNGSKTIQMLLELQSSKPPVETGERLNVRPDRGERLDASAKRPLAATAVPPPAAQASATVSSLNPFLRAIEQARPGATRDVAPPRANTAEWKDVGSQRAAVGSDGNGASRNEPAGNGTATPSEPVKLWFIAGLLRFVRENRESVLIGSVLALALVWLSASKATQRRR